MSPESSLEHLHAIELPTPFPVGPVTVYLATAPANAPSQPLTLIDTGPCTPQTRAALKSELARLGYALSDLERIVVTHAHVDHFGLAAEVVAASEAKLLTHPWNRPALAGYVTDRKQRVEFYARLLKESSVPAEVQAIVGRETRDVNRFAQPVSVDAALDEGDSLPLAGRDWQVLHMPGHAAGLICLYDPDSRTLLSSDHLLAGISSNPVVEPPPPGQSERLRSLALYLASLRRVAALEIHLVLPGHGPAIHNAASAVHRRLAFHDRRMAAILEIMRSGARTTWDIAQSLFPGRAPLDTFLAVSEVIGHLDLLQMEGSIVSEVVDGVCIWQAM
jgi:glyoxylase-like metal-dependent hydrolase (beta-lactamase superfamily II)